MKFALSVISILLIVIVVLVGMVLLSQYTKENRNGFQGASKIPTTSSSDKVVEGQQF
jgi:preprotein translocase subunit SecG